MKQLPLPALVAAALLVGVTLAPVHAGASSRSKVVVELFTSQGCNSCPPADALLGELAMRDDVLPLSFHITYWDRLGWPDTFGLEASDRRQRFYARMLGLRGVYTPQMVIGGRLDVVGSREGRVLRAIDILAEAGPSGPEITLEGLDLSIEAGAPTAARVLLAAFDTVHEVEIARGENRGRRLRYHHVVRELIDLGAWSGEARSYTLPLERLRREGRSSVALLVQRKSDGAILSASAVDL